MLQSISMECLSVTALPGRALSPDRHGTPLERQATSQGLLQSENLLPEEWSAPEQSPDGIPAESWPRSAGSRERLRRRRIDQSSHRWRPDIRVGTTSGI